MPEIANIVYDFDAKLFKDIRNGKTVDNTGFNQLVARPEARENFIGSTTFKRAAFANTIIRSDSSEGWRELLVQLSSFTANANLGELVFYTCHVKTIIK